MFLKISQYPQETPVLKACYFIEKSRCFLMNIAKFLRWPILKNICERLFLDCFNSSLLHRPKVSRSRLCEGPSHRSSFLFLSRHFSSWTESRPALESLRGIPLISQMSFYIGYFWLFQMVSGRSGLFLNRFRSFYIVLGHFRLL